MTLYLKYRPSSIDELDLGSVRELLGKVIESNNLPHAFLFSGPKGAGKTSAARILAKIINCEKNGEKLGEPCNECSQCLAIAKGNHIDVVEIDAASNRGIDDIRALRDSVLLAPSMGRKRVYIIDEAHMLTTEASNAFLKTLEEPPPHVVFIFATTEAHKLPQTVRSRLFNIPFSRATDAEIARQLLRVAKGEGVKVEEGLIQAIAGMADGSFREAVKIFEELVIVMGVTKEKEAKEYFARNIGREPIAFLKLLVDRDGAAALMAVEEMVGSGGDVNLFIDSLIGKLRGNLLAGAGVPQYEQIDFIDQDLGVTMLEMLVGVAAQVNRTAYPQLPLQIAVVKWCQDIMLTHRPDEPGDKQTHSGQGQNDKKEVAASQVKKKPTPSTLSGTGLPPQAGGQVEIPEGKLDKSAWEAILNTTRERDAKVEALLRSAEPLGYGDGALSIGVYYQFHKERLESSQINELFHNICAERLGVPVRVRYVLSEKKKVESEPPDLPLTADTPEAIINAAEEIFGG